MSYARGLGRAFYAPDTDPALPSDIAARVVGIVGLDNAAVLEPMISRRNPLASLSLSPQIGNGPNGSGLDPRDIKTAYNLIGLTVNGVSGGTILDGTGQTLGLFELDGYLASDIQTYETQYSLPTVTLQNVLLDGATGVPGTQDPL